MDVDAKEGRFEFLFAEAREDRMFVREGTQPRGLGCT
jgi:hypothetical protein